MAQTEFAENIDECHRPAAGADRDHVGDLASEAAVAAADLAVADDSGAQALAQIQVDEVVGQSGPVSRPFRASRPVDVVVDGDWPRHEPIEGIGRGQLADQEGCVGQVHESSGNPVDRVGRADHGEPDRPAASLRHSPAG